MLNSSKSFLVATFFWFFLGLHVCLWEVCEPPYNLSRPFSLVGVSVVISLVLVTVLQMLFHARLKQIVIESSREDTTVNRVVLAAFLFIFASAGTAFWVFYLLYQIDVRFDASPGQYQTSTIYERQPVNRRGGQPHHSYSLWVSDWNKAGAGRFVDVDADSYYKANKNDKLAMEIHEGALGFEYIKSYSVLNR